MLATASLELATVLEGFDATAMGLEVTALGAEVTILEEREAAFVEAGTALGKGTNLDELDEDKREALVEGLAEDIRLAVSTGWGCFVAEPFLSTPFVLGGLVHLVPGLLRFCVTLRALFLIAPFFTGPACFIGFDVLLFLSILLSSFGGSLPKTLPALSFCNPLPSFERGLESALLTEVSLVVPT